MLWCVGQLVQNEVWSSIGVLIIILLVVILLFWLVIRDYMSGIILKTDGSIKQNDWIRVQNIEGRITELGNRTMVVTADSGETITIPYSAISGEISAKPNPGEKLLNNSFEIKLSKLTDVESSVDQLRKGILNAPWSSVKKVPEIKLVGDQQQYYRFEINLYSIRMVHFQKIKDYLTESLTNAGYQIIS
jgi:small-conductance mechanosensitive channel